jgi:hypothetical protein
MESESASPAAQHHRCEKSSCRGSTEDAHAHGQDLHALPSATLTTSEVSSPPLPSFVAVTAPFGDITSDLTVRTSQYEYVHKLEEPKGGDTAGDQHARADEQDGGGGASAPANAGVIPSASVSASAAVSENQGVSSRSRSSQSLAPVVGRLTRVPEVTAQKRRRRVVSCVRKRTRIGDQFRCNLSGCGSTFDRQSKLDQHVRSHTGEVS